MAVDLIEKLKQGPAAEPTAEAAPAPKRKRGGRSPAGQARREARVPFGQDQPPPAADDPDDEPEQLTGPVGVAFTGAMAAQLRILWDEYEQRQRAVSGPKTLNYRCMGFKHDGTLCGAIVEAGTLEERLKTGEVIRCPHGPDAPEHGILFDRERWPRYHHELTPMEPIL